MEKNNTFTIPEIPLFTGKNSQENFALSSEWEQRTVAEEPRLSELVDLYKELGFEVMIKDFSPADLHPEECNTCMLDTPGKYKIIYTKIPDNSDNIE